MRKTTIVSFSLAVILLFAGTRAFAQQALPDYTKWQKIDYMDGAAVHNGKDVILRSERYMNIDADNLYSHVVVVIYDEKKNPWITFYTRVLLYKDGDNLVAAGFNYWLFDWSNNRWSLVKDFSQSKDLDKEVIDFLKSQYNLEFK